MSTAKASSQRDAGGPSTKGRRNLPRGRCALLGAFFVLFGAAPAALAWNRGNAGMARQEQSSKVTNGQCPVLPDEAVDPEVHTDYLGKPVYFCCRRCLKKFEAHPDEYVARLSPSPAADRSQGDDAGSQEHAEHSHDASSPEEHSHETEHDSEPAGHDHSARGGSLGALEPVAWAGRLHPMVVHFPIALLILAGVAEVIGAWIDSQRVAFASRFCLWFGALGALVAAPLGWADALGVGNDYTGFPAKVLLLHRWAGTLTALTALLTLAACERYYRRGAGSSRLWYRSGLALSSLLVIATGHLGASLIYGWEYLAP